VSIRKFSLAFIIFVFSIAGPKGQAQAGVSSGNAANSSVAISAQADDTSATQDPGAAPADPDPGADKDPVTMFPQHQWGRFWLSGQANFIEQAHGDFRALFSGPNSLRNTAEHAGSRIFTLYTAVRLSDRSDVVFHLEEASGFGLSNSLGLAGYTNIDVVRIPGEGSPLSTAPYLARLLFRYVVPLSDEVEEAEPGPLSILKTLPKRRLELRFGRFSLPDFVDVNAIGSDSHFQFMNWTLVNNGAYDYAADTRGYTWGGIVEYHDLNWSLRFVEALMPQIANGIDLEWNLRRAHAENIEAELRRSLVHGRSGTIRFLSYFNHANMGDYRQAVANFLAGVTPAPEITSHPFRTTLKYGFGVNAEQEITANFRVFARWGWNEGQHESFAFTEDDETVAFGGDFRGAKWGRKNDKVGAGFVTNGISADHQAYLARGGLGFLLGDGALVYGRENIVESYYTAHIWRGAFLALDLQHINNPGYDRARGPVWVPGARVHLEF
jgi:high affinity Mn2+ porin